MCPGRRDKVTRKETFCMKVEENKDCDEIASTEGKHRLCKRESQCLPFYIRKGRIKLALSGIYDINDFSSCCLSQTENVNKEKLSEISREIFVKEHQGLDGQR